MITTQYKLRKLTQRKKYFALPILSATIHFVLLQNLPPLSPWGKQGNCETSDKLFISLFPTLL